MIFIDVIKNYLLYKFEIFNIYLWSNFLIFNWSKYFYIFSVLISNLGCFMYYLLFVLELLIKNRVC